MCCVVVVVVVIVVVVEEDDVCCHFRRLMKVESHCCECRGRVMMMVKDVVGYVKM